MNAKRVFIFASRKPRLLNIVPMPESNRPKLSAFKGAAYLQGPCHIWSAAFSRGSNLKGRRPSNGEGLCFHYHFFDLSKPRLVLRFIKAVTGDGSRMRLRL